MYNELNEENAIDFGVSASGHYHVNRQNAIGFRAIGFNEKTYAAYTCDDKGSIFSEPYYWNASQDAFAAPDFLRAADWLRKEHGIMIAFYWHDTWLMEEGEIYTVKMRQSAGDDHRNAAIAHAILIVKERKK